MYCYGGLSEPEPAHDRLAHCAIGLPIFRRRGDLHLEVGLAAIAFDFPESFGPAFGCDLDMQEDAAGAQHSGEAGGGILHGALIRLDANTAAYPADDDDSAQEN